ncbi:MAG: hypothetical protein ACOCU4_09700 [Alkalispirochaeta sp.]
MKRYQVKSTAGVTAVMEILSSEPDGYRVRITRHHGDWDEIEESFMTTDLFDVCLRTAYIREIGDAAAAHVA